MSKVALKYIKEIFLEVSLHYAFTWYNFLEIVINLKYFKIIEKTSGL